MVLAVSGGKLLKQFLVLVDAGFTPLKRCVNEIMEDKGGDRLAGFHFSKMNSMPRE